MSSRWLTVSVAIGVAVITSFDGSTHYVARWTLLVGGWLWVATTPGRHRTSRLVLAVPGLILAFAALGSIRTERLVAASAVLSNVAFAAAVFWISTQASRTRIAATLDGFLAAAGFNAFWILGEALSGGARSAGGFFNPNHAGAWFAWASVYSALRGGPFGAGLCVVFGAAILATGSRSALLALIGGTLVILFARARRWAVAVCLASPLAVVAIAPLRARFLGVGDAFAFDRLTIWEAAWRAGVRQPWGWGVGDGPIALRQTGVSVLNGPVQFPKVAKHAHNELLQLWIELGVMTGVVIGLGLLLAAALVHFTRPGERVWTIAGITAIAIPAMLGETLRTPVLITSGALLLGYLVQRSGRTSSRRASAYALVVATLAVLAITPAVASRSLSERSATLRDQKQPQEALRTATRAETIAPYDLQARLLAASLRYQTSRDVKTALNELAQLATLFPGDPAPPERMVRLLENEVPGSERDTWIRRWLEERTVREPNNALVWVARARAHRRLGETEDTRRSLARALELEPHCARALAETALDTTDADDRFALAVRALHADRRSVHYRSHTAAVLRLPQRLRARMAELVPAGFSIPTKPLQWRSP